MDIRDSLADMDERMVKLAQRGPNQSYRIVDAPEWRFGYLADGRFQIVVERATKDGVSWTVNGPTGEIDVSRATAEIARPALQLRQRTC
jgi:hypothetical protein